MFKTFRGLMTGLAILALIGLVPYYEYGTAYEIDITVTDKDRIVESGETTSSKYLIFTRNHDVLENTDSIFWFKFNSSSVQGKLQIGGTYRVKVYGWRIGLFSMYPNIVAVVE